MNCDNTHQYITSHYTLTCTTGSPIGLPCNINTSTALLSKYFFSLNQKTYTYIPDRKNEGYGPSVNAFDKLYNLVAQSQKKETNNSKKSKGKNGPKTRKRKKNKK